MLRARPASSARILLQQRAGAFSQEVNHHLQETPVTSRLRLRFVKVKIICVHEDKQGSFIQMTLLSWKVTILAPPCLSKLFEVDLQYMLDLGGARRSCGIQSD